MRQTCPKRVGLFQKRRLHSYVAEHSTWVAGRHRRLGLRCVHCLQRVEIVTSVGESTQVSGLIPPDLEAA